MTVALLAMIVVLGACGRGDDRGPATQRPVATTLVAASSDAAVKLAPPPPATLTARAAAEEQAAISRLPAGPGRDLVAGNCLICHAATMIEQQHKDTTAWNKTVTQMIAWGAPVPSDRRAELVTYLAKHFSSAGGTRRTADARMKSWRGSRRLVQTIPRSNARTASTSPASSEKVAPCTILGASSR